jgi:hypothetical protein
MNYWYLPSDCSLLAHRRPGCFDMSFHVQSYRCVFSAEIVYLRFRKSQDYEV